MLPFPFPSVNMRRVTRILGLILASAGLLLLAACRNPGSEVVPGNTQPSTSQTPAATPIPSSTATPTDIPHRILGVAPGLVEAAAAAINDLAAVEPKWVIQLNPSPPDGMQLENGLIDLALMPDGDGIPVAYIPLVLAVPFESDWDDLTLEAAQEIIRTGSPFVAVLEWPEMTPDLRALRVDGFHPGEAGYPLHRSWSLHARPESEDTARALAPLLASRIHDDRVASLAAVGDVMLDRTFRVMLTAGELDFPWRHLGPQLRDADLAIGNLESALGTDGRPESKGYTFRAPPEAAGSLAWAGFDLMSLANNHALDFGPTVLEQAIQLLADQGIGVVGAGEDEAAAHRPVFREVNGLRLAFLAYVDVPLEYRGFDAHTWEARGDKAGVAWAYPDRIRSDVSAAHSSADLVIVILHSGYEYVVAPNEEQIAAAHAAIEAGADLVLGHHAHVLQGVELYQGGVIAYGLGNFAFEDAGPPESGLLQLWLDGDGVRAFDLVPVTLDEFGRPWPAEGETASAVRKLWIDRSRALLNVP
jgi:poly-gamma-glutamate synthesis protein (capsule biosynthesis protein)